MKVAIAADYVGFWFRHQRRSAAPARYSEPNRVPALSVPAQSETAGRKARPFKQLRVRRAYLAGAGAGAAAGAFAAGAAPPAAGAAGAAGAAAASAFGSGFGLSDSVRR